MWKGFKQKGRRRRRTTRRSWRNCQISQCIKASNRKEERHGSHDVIASCLCPGYSKLCAIVFILVRSVKYHHAKRLHTKRKKIEGHGAHDVYHFKFVSWIQQIVSHYLHNCKISQISQCEKTRRSWRISLHVCVLDTANCVPESW